MPRPRPGEPPSGKQDVKPSPPEEREAEYLERCRRRKRRQLVEFINRPPSGRGRAGTLNRAWPCGFLIRKLLDEGHDPLKIEAELHAYHRRFAGIAEPTDHAEAYPADQEESFGRDTPGQFEDAGVEDAEVEDAEVEVAEIEQVVVEEVEDGEQSVENEQVTLQRRPFEADDSDDDSNPDLANVSEFSGPLRSKSSTP